MLCKIRILIFNVILIISNSFSQERVGYFTNSLKENSSKIKDVIPIVNSKTNDIAMFIADAKKVYAYKLDAKFNVIDQLASDKKRRKYKTLIGNSISDENNYAIYLANEVQNEFLIVNFSFDGKVTTSKEFEFETFEEEFVQTISLNNKLHIISTSFPYNLFIYTFDTTGKYTRNKINLENVSLVSNIGDRMLISTTLKNNGKEIKKMVKNSPNALELVGDKVKMYIRDNSVLFSFDNNNEITQILSINLIDYMAKVKTFKKAMKDVKRNRKESNSYINDENIYIVTANKKKLVLNIFNFENNKVLKTYTILKEQPISFKNTPIIQEEDDDDDYKELKSTKKFLKEIYANEIGVSARKIENGYQITLGGYEYNNYSVFVDYGFNQSTFSGVSIFFNPVLHAYNTSISTKSTRIECLLDKKLNHNKNGEVKEHVFDKIKDFNKIKTKGSSKKAETIFKYDNYHILGLYYPKRKQYIFTKFTD